MFLFCLFLAFLSAFSFIMGMFPVDWESRPTLETFGYDVRIKKRGGRRFSLLRIVSLINKPLCVGVMGARIRKDLVKGRVAISPEEFFLLKEISVILISIAAVMLIPKDMLSLGLLIGVMVGYLLPEYWLKGKIKQVRQTILKELPDAVDLLGLCVNAGLDFMLALKWVVEKSPPSVMINELNILLQEINVGKTRRDALKSLAQKYDLPDLSTFTRTLIQADKMGTSVAEALNILSEDMRLARFRRGEQLAMKAPIKLLVPLMCFIFPVVGILVAGPIFIQFMTDNPLSKIGGKK